MKINPIHFKFEVKSRRFKKSVWEKYYSLKNKKEKLNDYDKFWVQQLRAQIKINQFKMVGTHLPTKTSLEWTVKEENLSKPTSKKVNVEKLLAKVKETRAKNQTVKKATKTFEGAKYELIGNVFEKPGQIVPLASQLTINDPMKPKKPRRKDNYIGIELEFNILDRNNSSAEQKSIAKAFKDVGLAKYVDVTSDGSCGWEVRVLLLENEFETHLTKILTVLNGFGFQTNEKCGTHVHFDMRNRDVKLVYKNLFKTQKFLRKFLTRNRKHNSYCKMNKMESFDDQMNIGDRYYSLNVQSYERHHTLEVRMHQGTLKADELIPWIHLLTRIVNYNNDLPKTVNTLRQAKEQFNIEEELVQDLEERIMSVFTKKDASTGLLREIFGNARGDQ